MANEEGEHHEEGEDEAGKGKIVRLAGWISSRTAPQALQRYS